MCKFTLLCSACGKSVTIDNPDSSKFPPVEAYCKDCWKMIKNKDARIFGAAIKRLSQRGVIGAKEYKEAALG